MARARILLTFALLRALVGIIGAVVRIVADPRDRYAPAVVAPELPQRTGELTCELKKKKRMTERSFSTRDGCR